MKRLDNLQIMRGIAAALVVVDHTLLAAAAHDPAYVPFMGFAATIGRMGVNLFFIISGFIMVHSTEATQQLNPSARLQDFIWKRGTRLVPLYWLATFVQIIVGVAAGLSFSLSHILTSLIFLPNFPDMNDPRMPPVLGVGWTLNYEAFFYCIFAVTLLLPRKIGLVACIVTMLAIVSIGVLGAKYVGDGVAHRIFLFYTFKNLLFFAIGIAIAMGQGAQGRFLPKLVGGWSLGVALLLMTAALALFRIMRFNDGDPVWQTISLAVCTSAILLAVSGGGGRDSALHRVFLHVGNASFSTYLFHAMMLGALASAEARLLGPSARIVLLLTGPLLCLAMGSIIHICLEIPLTKIVRYAGGNRRVASAAGSQGGSVVLEP